MTSPLHQAAEDFMAGRKARKELTEISDRKIAQKMEIHYSVVVRAWAGLPTRLSAEDLALVLGLKHEQKRLQSLQRGTTLARVAHNYKCRQCDVVAELQRMGVGL
jgi:hypothetical protein